MSDFTYRLKILAESTEETAAMFTASLILHSICCQIGELIHPINLPLGPLPRMRPGQVEEEM